MINTVKSKKVPVLFTDGLSLKYWHKLPNVFIAIFY